MANLDNFTIDEELIVINVCALDFVLNKLSEITGLSKCNFRQQLAIANGELISCLSDDEIREIIDNQRQSQREGRENARQNIQA